MSDHRHASVFAVLLLVTLVPVTLAGATPTEERASAGANSANASVLVVDDSGGAEYASIRAAVDAASAGDTVEVRPGTYREQVTIDTNITLIAPDGATMNGSRFEGLSHGFRIEPGVAPVVEGFTIQNYAYGIDAERAPHFGATGESSWDVGWIVRNVTIANCSEEGILAGNSVSDWTVESVAIEECSVGVAAYGSLGDWTIRNTVIRAVTITGISADSEGDWTIRNVTMSGTPSTGISTGIEGSSFSGTGYITDTTIRRFNRAIGTDRMNGSVTVTHTLITNISHPADEPAYNGVAVRAVESSGRVRIRNSIIRNYSRIGINATEVDPPVDATGNWWGPDGPTGNACTGTVRCGDPLADRPDAGSMLVDPGAPISDASATRTSTPPVSRATSTTTQTSTPPVSRATSTTTVTVSTPTPTTDTGAARAGDSQRLPLPGRTTLFGVGVLGTGAVVLLIGIFRY